jgi:sulfite exporter TauE/SafE
MTTMTDLSLISALLIGLAGSVHCVGMCGGIVSAFSFAIPKGSAQWPYIVAYNVGRIASYTLLGGLTGYMGSLVTSNLSGGLLVLQLISALFLLLMACYIGNWWRGLSYLERAGAILWRKIRPWSKALLPFKHPLYALPYGVIWGWLPCGLVYSTLTWSLASGGGYQGATIMLFFGLGTLPALIAMAASIESIKHLLTHPLTRQVVASCLLIFALKMLWQAY